MEDRTIASSPQRSRKKIISIIVIVLLVVLIIAIALILSSSKKQMASPKTSPSSFTLKVTEEKFPSLNLNKSLNLASFENLNNEFKDDLSNFGKDLDILEALGEKNQISTKLEKVSQELKEARDNYKQSPNETTRQILSQKTKNFLMAHYNDIKQRLVETKNQLNQSIKVSSEEQKKILAEINKEIMGIDKKINQLPNLTSEQVRDEAKSVLQLEAKSDPAIKKIIGEIIIEKINTLVEKTASLNFLLNQEIAKAPELGNWSSVWQNKTRIIQSGKDQARAQFEKSTTSPEFFKEGVKLTKEIKEVFNELGKALTQLITPS